MWINQPPPRDFSRKHQASWKDQDLLSSSVLIFPILLDDLDWTSLAINCPLTSILRVQQVGHIYRFLKKFSLIKLAWASFPPWDFLLNKNYFAFDANLIRLYSDSYNRLCFRIQVLCKNVQVDEKGQLLISINWLSIDYLKWEIFFAAYLWFSYRWNKPIIRYEKATECLSLVTNVYL